MRIGAAEVLILQGDLTESSAEALVNAANSELWMGAGVAGALKRKGGPEIEREAMAKGPIEVGEAVSTGAGRLPARWIIHAAVMGPDLRTDAAKIRQATRAALRLADQLGIRSIAFPALGTGVGGFPMAGCGRLMMEVTRAYLAAGSNLARVEFVLFGAAAYREFREGAEVASQEVERPGIS